MQALKNKGYEVIGIDFDPDKLDQVIGLDVDVVFIGMHGKHGEDGCVQGLLDMLNIPYVGSGVLASALAMNKAKAKELFAKAGIPVANGKQYRITRSMNIRALVDDIHKQFSFPFVVKPNREGSTLGLTTKDRKSTRLNSSHVAISYAVFCLKKKKKTTTKM